MLELFELNFDADGDGVLDSTAQAVDLDGDGTVDALLMDIGDDGAVDFVAMDTDGNDVNFDSMEIFAVDEENGEVTLVPIDELETFGEEEVDAPGTEEDPFEIEDQLNKGILRSPAGVSGNVCRDSHTNQNYCTFSGANR